MSMKIWLATGYITTTLLGGFCPSQLAAAMPIREPMQHIEMVEIAMTPVVPMTLARPVSLISASHTMPMPFSGDCPTGLCMGSHANQQLPSGTTVTVQRAGSMASHVIPLPILLSSTALPAPPDVGIVFLAQSITTIVLRV